MASLQKKHPVGALLDCTVDKPLLLFNVDALKHLMRTVRQKHARKIACCKSAKASVLAFELGTSEKSIIFHAASFYYYNF